MAHDDFNFDHDGPSAARTLDAIRSGGQQLIMLTNRRMDDARKALQQGDFSSVVSFLQGAVSSVAPLANAQSFIGIACEGRIVRARDLEPGMDLVRIGTVTGVEVRECQAADCDGHVKVTVGEHEPLDLTGDVELWVATDGAE